MEKRHLRRQIQHTLKQLLATQLQQKSRDACANLCLTEEFRQARVVMLFLSLAREIDTTFALQSAFSEEKTVLVPKVIWGDSKIVPVRFTALDDECEPDRYGLRNPVQSEIVPAGEIDLVVVPGLAFAAGDSTTASAPSPASRPAAADSLFTNNCCRKSRLSPRICRLICWSPTDKFYVLKKNCDFYR